MSPELRKGTASALFVSGIVIFLGIMLFAPQTGHASRHGHRFAAPDGSLQVVAWAALLGGVFGSGIVAAGGGKRPNDEDERREPGDEPSEEPRRRTPATRRLPAKRAKKHERR